MAYAHGNTTMVALVGLSNIVFAGIYDVVFWNGSFDLWHIVGVTMIAMSIVLNVTRSARRTSPETVDVTT